MGALPASSGPSAAKTTTCRVSNWKTTPCPSNALPRASRAIPKSEEPAAPPALASTREPESMPGEFASVRSALPEKEIQERLSTRQPLDRLLETDIRPAHLFVGTNVSENRA